MRPLEIHSKIKAGLGYSVISWKERREEQRDGGTRDREREGERGRGEGMERGKEKEWRRYRRRNVRKRKRKQKTHSTLKLVCHIVHNVPLRKRTFQ